MRQEILLCLIKLGRLRSLFSEQHMGNDRVKLTKYGKIEWDEKCHYGSDILFE